jgi:hypothetical protein
MMPYDGYRLYQAERSRSAAEIRYADEQAGQFAAAAAALFRSITQLRRTARARRRRVQRQAALCAAEPVTRC